MRRVLNPLVLLLIAVIPLSASGQTPDRTGHVHPSMSLPEAEVVKRLNRLMDFKGISGAKIPLRDALEYVSDVYDITIIVDERALEEAGFKDGLDTPLTKPVAAMRNATPRQALYAVVSTAASRQGISILVILRRDYFEITTLQGLVRELGSEWRRFCHVTKRVMRKPITIWTDIFQYGPGEAIRLLRELSPLKDVADLAADAALLLSTANAFVEGIIIQRCRGDFKLGNSGFWN